MSSSAPPTNASVCPDAQPAEPVKALGAVRVIHIRTPAEDTQGEVVIKVDRTNPILGNRHILKHKLDPVERQQCIEAFRQDIDDDIARHGPMWQEVERIAALVRDGAEVALSCHCHPLPCHGDVIAERIMAAACRPQTRLTLESFGQGYRPRTIRNAETAEATVAFAVDFSTAGERLTAKAAGPRYVGIPLGGDPVEAARILYRHLRHLDAHTLNVAGNGIYTLAGRGFTQSDVDRWLFQVLRQVHEHWPLKEVRSGGQTGVDTAGLVAAVALGIPAVSLFPEGFRRRGADGEDHPSNPEDVRAEIEDAARKLHI